MHVFSIIVDGKPWFCSNPKYFIRLLAVLDARLGKRKVKALVDNINNEPEWIKRWILLRADLLMPN